MSGGTGFFGSPIYKKVMSKVYGWGAAVAILGALFKIMHYPGSAVMLTAGLGVEAIIFFLSAFEPPHEMPDWSLVYPELVGLEPREKIGSFGTPVTSSSIEIGSLNAGTQLDPKAMAKLGDGINSFTQTVDQLSNLGDIGAATAAYLTSLKSAAGSVNSLTEVQTHTTQNIRQSSEALSESYVTAAKAIAESGIKIAGNLTKSGDSLIETVQTNGRQLTETYKSLGTAMNQQLEQVSAGTTKYSENLAGANKNLSAINSVYELHLSSINAQVSEVNKLSQTLGELNTIYGNMLNVMNMGK